MDLHAIECLRQKNNIYIAGVDEVGRGPLAGPVVTAAVILSSPLEGLTDSKKLTPKRRKVLAKIIQEEALCFSYGRAEAYEIDTINIHQATLLAMQRAVEGLSIAPDAALIDGIHVPQALSMSCYPVIKGDSLVPEISAASILAKVKRDEEMEALDLSYPGYGFASHKGYPTAVHLKALENLGPCDIHRKSFGPVARALSLQTIE